MTSKGRRLSMGTELFIAYFILYSLTYLVDLFFYYKFREPIFKEWANIRLVLLLLFSVLYGISHVIRVNPYVRGDYRKWLALTPWDSNKPLPLGSVFITWKDIIGLGILTLLCYLNGNYSIFWPAIAFLGGYLLCSIAAVVEENASVILAFVFLIPFAIYPHRDPRWAFIVLIAIYMIFYYGLKKQFKNFPWNTGIWKFNLIEKLKKEAFNQRLIGWPMDCFTASEQQGFDLTSGLILSLLITWWVYIVQWFFRAESSISLLLLVAFLVVQFRLIIYIARYRAPISLFGRLFTGRFIIPSYDKVFVAPICIFLVPVMAIPLVHWINHTLLFNSGIFLIFFLAFILPPSRKKWQLTAPCRIRPLLKMQNNTRPTKENIFWLEAASASISLFKKKTK